MTIQNKPVGEILRDLFIQGLNLPTSYGISEDNKVIPSVYVRDRRINYGHTSQLQIEIQSIGSKIFYNRNYIDNSGIENRDVGTQELYQIVMTSEDESAELRKHELISLLSSQLSISLQEQWNIKLGVIPNSVNTNSVTTGPYSILRTVITIFAISMKTYTIEQPNILAGVDYNPNVDDIDESNIISVDLN